MAETRRIRHPYVEYYEQEADEVVVELYVPDLIPASKDKEKKLAKNGYVDVCIMPQGFDFEGDLVGGKDGKEKRRWEHKVRRLPGQVIPNQSKWSVEKGKVIVSLRKTNCISWTPSFRDRGLDQWSSSEEEETAAKNKEKKLKNNLCKESYHVVDSRTSSSEDQLSASTSVGAESVAGNLGKVELDEKARKQKMKMNTMPKLT